MEITFKPDIEIFLIHRIRHCNAYNVFIFCLHHVTGYSTRELCGSEANPSGLFISFFTRVNPFNGIPALEDNSKIDLTSRIYAYFAMEEVSELSSDKRGQVKNSVQSIDQSLATFSTYLVYIFGNDDFNAYISHLRNVTGDIAVILGFLDENIMESEVSYIVTAFNNIWTYTTILDDVIIEMNSISLLTTDPTIATFLRSLANSVQPLRDLVDTAINILSSSLFNSIPPSTGFGMKMRIYITLFDTNVGLDVEFVYSEKLFQCSRFSALANYFDPGEKAIAFLGTIEVPIPFGELFEVDVGGGFGGAFSTSRLRFAYRISVYASLFDISVTSDLFYTFNGIYTYIEGNIFNLFFAQIDIYTGIGENWYDLIYKVSGRFAIGDRRKRQIQTNVKSFDGSLKDALQKAVIHVSDMVTSRLDAIQELVKLQQSINDAARGWLHDRLNDLKGAKEIHTNNLSKLDKARKFLRNAKKPFQKALELLTSAQRAVDNLCSIKTCALICVPGIKCRVCWKKVWLVKIPYPCCWTTNCMIRIPNPICVLYNVGCTAVRFIAYGALEFAKMNIRAPMIVLDSARAAVIIAQSAVEGSSFVVALSEAAVVVADMAFDVAKAALEFQHRQFAFFRDIVKIASPILQAIAVNAGNLLDVKNCGFELALRTTQLPVFNVSCDIKLSVLGWKRIRMRINFNDILQSLWSVAKAIVSTFFDIDVRRKRDISTQAAFATHRLIRKVRNAQQYSNHSFDATKEDISVVELTMGFKENTTNDYDSRVALFSAKCTLIERYLNFLDATINTLFNISQQSKEEVDRASDINSQVGSYKYEARGNMTLEDAGVDTNYGQHYNLTRDEMQKAMDDGLNQSSSDPTVIEIDYTLKQYKEAMNIEVSSIESHGYADSWMLSIENIANYYFNETECVTFRDCVLYVIGEIFDIYAEETHANISEIKRVLSDIENGIFNIVKNDSFNIIGIYNQTSEIKDNMDVFSDLNIYCSDAPVIQSHPQNVTTVIGGNASFFCGAKANPEPVYSWFQSNKVMPLETSFMLVIQNVSMNNSQSSYRCMVGNLVANITSDEAYVHLIGFQAGKKKE